MSQSPVVQLVKVLCEHGADVRPVEDPEALVAELMAAYERHVLTTRLQELLRDRGPGEIVIRRAPQPERAEARPCRACGEPIQPGGLYVVEGPYHIGCKS